MAQVQLRSTWSVWMWAGVGALAVALAVVAGPAQAQPPTTRSETSALDPISLDGTEGKLPGEQPRRAPANDPKPQPQPAAMTATQTANVKVVTKPPTPTTRAWVLEEVTTGFLIVMLSLVGIVAMAVATRYYFRITTPTDPYHLALTDPWVRAHLAVPPADTPAAQPTEPDAPAAIES
jgi:hypothetical protein